MPRLRSTSSSATWFFSFIAAPLRRDEVQTVNIALSPTVSDLWRDLEFDSFPALWPATIRCWASLFGESDGSLRVLGLFVGLSILAAVWYGAWQLGRGFPVLALALFALCPTVIRYGDTLRGYGLGTLLLLLMYAQVLEGSFRADRAAIVLGVLAAVLAVHSIYYNAVFSLALGIASAAIALAGGRGSGAGRRRHRIAGGGFAAAVRRYALAGKPVARHPEIRRFHLPTGHDVRRGDERFQPFCLRRLVGHRRGGRCGRRVHRRRPFSQRGWRRRAFRGRGRPCRSPGRCCVSRCDARNDAHLVRHALDGLSINRFRRVRPVGCDAVFDRPDRTVVRATALFALTAPAARNEMQIRMTNIDLIASVLEEQAVKGDLIVVAHGSRG